MKEMLYPFADKYFFNGVIVGTMLTLIELTLLSWITKTWSLFNLIALITFVSLFSIALAASSKMYKVRE